MPKAATKIELWPTAQLKPYEKNAKIHPPKQVQALAKIIEKHGFDQAIVVDRDGIIIKGHGRLEAAKHLGLKKVPVVVRDDLTPAQVRAARIADNTIAEMGKWDSDLLASDVREALELFPTEFDPDGRGYRRQYELIMFFGALNRTDLSDVWQLNRDPRGDYQHPTQKPVALAAKALTDVEARDVYDPFGGSGSTLLAAEQLGIPCTTVELEPKYCDVIVQRWELLTGLKAERIPSATSSAA